MCIIAGCGLSSTGCRENGSGLSVPIKDMEFLCRLTVDSHDVICYVELVRPGYFLG